MSVFMVTHKMVFHNQQVRNVYFYETITGNPSNTEWQDIVDEIRADWAATIGLSALVTAWSFYGIDYRQVDQLGLPSFTANPTAGELVGTNGDDSAATQVALLISAKANTTKPNRVRNYYCGFASAAMTDSIWGSSIRGVVEDFFDEQTVLNGAGTNVLQRVSAQWNSSHTQVVDYNNVAASPGLASPVPATQRRRRIGVGI